MWSTYHGHDQVDWSTAGRNPTFDTYWTFFARDGELYVLQSVVREEHVEEHERFYVDFVQQWKEGKMPFISDVNWERDGNRFVFRATYVLNILALSRLASWRRP